MPVQETNDPVEELGSDESPFRPVDLAKIGGLFLLAGFVSFVLLFFNCVLTMGMCSGGTELDVLMAVGLGASGVGGVILVSALVWLAYIDLLRH